MRNMFIQQREEKKAHTISLLVNRTPLKENLTLYVETRFWIEQTNNYCLFITKLTYYHPVIYVLCEFLLPPLKSTLAT